MNRRGFLAGLLGAGAAAFAGCSGTVGSHTPTPPDEIGMTASAFDPAEYVVSVGGTVTWRNTNSRAHTVTAYENSLPDDADYFASGGYQSEPAAREAFWDSFGGAIPGNANATFEHTFTVAGRYDYFCVPHERGGMTGTILVQD